MIPQLHHPVSTFAVLLEVHSVFEDKLLLSMRKWMHDTERKWDAHHQENQPSWSNISEWGEEIMVSVCTRIAKR
jgi:hypothetical protein